MWLKYQFSDRDSLMQWVCDNSSKWYVYEGLNNSIEVKRK